MKRIMFCGVALLSLLVVPTRAAEDVTRIVERRAAVAHRPARALPSVASTAADLKAAFATAAPRSLAAADFDEDGMPDLAAGYAAREGTGGLVAIWRGNVDAVYGWSKEARRRREKGTFTDAPFLGPPALFPLQEPVDFLAAGDFDGDGHKDLAAGALGGEAVYLLPGDGHGDLGTAEAIALPGRITAWAAGEVNRGDGLEDLVVAVEGGARSGLLVFEGPNGALRRQPEMIRLAGPVAKIALGSLDSDLFTDVAVAGGSELSIVHGRDRRLSLGALANQVASPPGVTVVALPSAEAEAVPELKRALELLGVGSQPVREDEPIASLSLRLDGDGTLDSVLLSREGPMPIAVGLAVETTWVVNSNADSTDGSCDLLGEGTGNQDCTLREALLAASSGESINFSIPHMFIFPPTISVTGPLPTIGAGITLDGTTQSQGSVVLSGTGAGTGVPGLRVTGTNNVIRGLRIGNFDGSGIELAGASNQVEECFVGLGGLGTPAPNGDAGIDITAGSNTVGCTAMSPCNVISANSGPGIRIEGASEVELIAGNVVEGNYIGTNASGTSALANGSNGVRIRFASQSRIGGTAAGSGNVISGNAAAGVHLLDVELTLVEGNYIGTDAAGSSDLGNGAAGVTLNDDSTTNTIGGTTAAARNVISGNRASGSGRGIGFGLGEIATDNNLIQGNYIGTDASGTSAVGNDYGIRHGEGASTNDLIGGAVAGAGNLISGNTWGISFEADMFVQGVSILGNYIGTDAAGSGDLGNQRAGVRFLFPDPLGIFSTVPLGDGTTAGANRIAFNRCGVLVDSGNRRPLRGNEIFANEDLGISLVDDPSLSSCATDRVTLNDPNDADLGPNGLENFPVLTAVYTTTGATVVDGTYHGAPNTTTHLDFYSSLQCDPSGFGEGESYLGSTTIVTDGSGNAAFSYSTSLLPGHWVTATATRNFPPDTSEFSVCRRDHATCGAPPNLILEAGTIADAQTFEACETITVGNSNADPFSIETSGDLTLRAGLSVAMLNGFQVLGSLVVEIDPTP